VTRKRVRPRRVRPPDPFPKLPALPIVALVEGLIAREDRNRRLGPNDPMPTGAREDICAWLGIQPRSLLAWRVGQRERIQFEIVDQILTRSGAGWWEVFTAETCRVPALVVRHYGHRSGKGRRGTRTLELRGRDVLGDLGPDHAAVALAERAFTGCDVGLAVAA
jgi:hypothetical protein